MRPDFGARLCYVDIETTGLDVDGDHITVATVVCGDAAHTYVDGSDMTQLPDAFPADAVLVTFHGQHFDVPFLRARFGGAVPCAGIDLSPVLRAYGYAGGLKQIEPRLGIHRDEGDVLTGEDAVALWQRYSDKNDCEALESLKAYNRRDACSLRDAMAWLYRRSMRGFPKPFCSLTTE